ncbi:hypothetical protein NPIL_382281 [Nephila pilipes]|uniref:Uncharacterized protein n=1 Tax=Nephila pilipes TaxID=299642 RepID=A0A8X6UAP7_NEPPI|nr:hypothetical protein NPIL_382281 [Nephila pilipes]
MSREIYEIYSPRNDSEEKTVDFVVDKYFYGSLLKSQDTSQPFQPSAIYDKNSEFYESFSIHGSSKNTISLSIVNQNVRKRKKNLTRPTSSHRI